MENVIIKTFMFYHVAGVFDNDSFINSTVGQ